MFKYVFKVICGLCNGDLRKGVLKGGQKKSSGLKQHNFGYSTNWPFCNAFFSER